MSARDPDDPERRVEPEETPDARPDVNAVFAEIVSGWQAEGTAPQWPDSPTAPGRAAGAGEPIASDPVAAEPDGRPSTGPAAPDLEGQFVPPEPPPLPRIRRRTVGGLALIGLGLLLVILPDLIGLSHQLGLLLGLIAMTSGVGWLVLGLREGPPTDSGWDDGAVL